MGQARWTGAWARWSPRSWTLGLVLALTLCSVTPAAAHPVPFSFVDLTVVAGRVEATVVVHVFDVAHDLGVEPMERLLDPGFLASRADQIRRLLEPRFVLRLDGEVASGRWSAPEAVPDRQVLRFQVQYPVTRVPGELHVRTALFPYDPEHRTFLNVYEQRGLVLQSILDPTRIEARHFTGTRQGTWAVMRTFLPSGVHHILIGPDHILFLVGLLLTGGNWRRLLLVVTAFTLAHSVTLSLSALNIYTPPAWLIEPTIALSIVYVGIDNLLRRGGRDVRAWIAFVFGFIHGFGFANVLREFGLPARSLGWSLFSFNVGVEVGQLAVVVVVASDLQAGGWRSVHVAERVAWVGSVAVIAAGAYWFVERTFFSGGF